MCSERPSPVPICSHRVKTKPRSKHTHATKDTYGAQEVRAPAPLSPSFIAPSLRRLSPISPPSPLSAPRAHTKALSHHSPLSSLPLSLAPALSPTRPHTAQTPKKIANLSSLHSLYSSNTHTKALSSLLCDQSSPSSRYRRLPTVPSPLLSPAYTLSLSCCCLLQRVS